MNVDDLHTSFARMNRAAVPALAPALIGVELFKHRRQVLHDALQLHFRAIDQLVAVRTVPFEGVKRSLGPRYFNDHSDGFRRPPRGVAQVFWQKKDFAFFDRYFQWWLARRLH